MSIHHIEALANLANLHYIASQIHARTPVTDETGKSVVDYMNDATKHLNQSMVYSNTGDPQNSLFSLRQAYQHTHGVMGMLMGAGEKQVSDAGNGTLPLPTLKANMDDIHSYIDNHATFLEKSKAIIAHEQEKGIAQRDSARDSLNNAREVIDSIADENNLLLPGSWTRHGDEPAPNGE